MKRPELLLGGIVLAGAAFVAGQARQAPPRRGHDSAADSATVTDTADGLRLSRVRRSTLPPPPPKDFADMARRLDAARDRTYLDDILAARDNNIARWPDRGERPIAVWVQPRPGLRDFRPEFRNRARDAFYMWSAAGVPLTFLFVDDSLAAEVRLRWVYSFDDGPAGKTFWSRDQNWWIVEADVEIALHSSAGEAYDGQAIRKITLHEVGHLIGLDHSPDPNDVMAARVHVMGLSAADLRTALLIYSLPPGSVLP